MDLKMGKYKGLSIEDACRADAKYMTWLSNNTDVNDPKWGANNKKLKAEIDRCLGSGPKHISEAVNPAFAPKRSVAYASPSPALRAVPVAPPINQLDRIEKKLDFVINEITVAKRKQSIPEVQVDQDFSSPEYSGDPNPEDNPF